MIRLPSLILKEIYGINIVKLSGRCQFYRNNKLPWEINLIIEEYAVERDVPESSKRCIYSNWISTMIDKETIHSAFIEPFRDSLYNRGLLWYLHKKLPELPNSCLNHLQLIKEDFVLIYIHDFSLYPFPLCYFKTIELFLKTDLEQKFLWIWEINHISYRWGSINQIIHNRVLRLAERKKKVIERWIKRLEDIKYSRIIKITNKLNKIWRNIDILLGRHPAASNFKATIEEHYLDYNWSPFLPNHNSKLKSLDELEFEVKEKIDKYLSETFKKYFLWISLNLILFIFFCFIIRNKRNWYFSFYKKYRPLIQQDR